ncbi:hypothetical protein CEXT_436951 [Caerostris extrusa]|uniref:Ycf15 n=1 Tax=Caerostris extrusa TaxID=172846 RepID=A0AAV4XEF6_CAEEX|nr:hypothetical protein CEXT_436951 [Caerostris extrusa]
MNRSCHKETMLLHNGAGVRTRAQPHFIHLIWNCEIYRFIWEPFIVIISFVGVGEREVLGKIRPQRTLLFPHATKKNIGKFWPRDSSLYLLFNPTGISRSQDI